MSEVDVLIVTGLRMEFEAACDVGLLKDGSPGVVSWEERDIGTPTPYVIGDFISNGKFMRVALAHGERIGGRYLSPVASYLFSRLEPRCIAMSGACAGNRADVAFGDVIIADMTFQYDEGKVTQDGFLPDHRPDKLRDSAWIRLLGELKPQGLPSHGVPSDSEAELWLLEQTSLGRDVKAHPARKTYFPDEVWEERVKALMNRELIYREGRQLKLTAKGRDIVDERHVFGTPPKKLPFRIKVGPIASGNVVVKDDRWAKLQEEGVRTVLALEMEAATVGTIGSLFNRDWIVMKAVMDYGDPSKDDRFKAFAARASAEVLFPFLMSQFGRDIPASARRTAEIARTNATDPGALEQIATRAFIELIAALYDAGRFLPGGGMESIPRCKVSPFVPDELMERIKSQLEYNASLEDIAQAFLDKHLIDDALKSLVKKIHYDWDKLLPHAKRSMHELSEKYPDIGLANLPALTSEETEVVGIKWLISDGMFLDEWRSWTDDLVEHGLDLVEKKIAPADLNDQEKIRYYCDRFESLIGTRIEIDLALVRVSTKVGFRRVFDYLILRAERTKVQVMAVVDEICRSHPQPLIADRLLAAPMRDIVAPLIKDPLQVAPSAPTMEAIKEALKKYP